MIRTAKIFSCFCLFVAISIFPFYALAVDVKITWPQPEPEDLGPGTVPDGVSFPLVFYIFATEKILDRAARIDPGLIQRYAQGCTLPVYIGFLVINRDFTLDFVKKSEWEVDLSDIVDDFNSTPENGDDMVYFVSLSGFPYRAPRKSWNGMSAAKQRLDLIPGYQIFLSYGVSPDDTFVPEFAETYTVTFDSAGRVSGTPFKDKKIILRNAPAGAVLVDVSDTGSDIPLPPAVVPAE